MPVQGEQTQIPLREHFLRLEAEADGVLSGAHVELGDAEHGRLVRGLQLDGHDAVPELGRGGGRGETHVEGEAVVGLEVLLKKL